MQDTLMQEMMLALVAFAFVTSVTPGPNNLMLLSSGVTWGVRRTVPHILGIAGGHALMMLCLGLGLAQVFEAHPVSHTIMKLASAIYMTYLAWRIATAGAPGENRSARPLTWLEAAAFQWVNPKSWAMALTAVTVYLPDGEPASLLAVAAIFAAVNLPSVGVWAVMGQAMQGVLREPRFLRAFNITMALLLLASMIPILAG